MILCVYQRSEVSAVIVSHVVGHNFISEVLNLLECLCAY